MVRKMRGKNKGPKLKYWIMAVIFTGIAACIIAATGAFEHGYEFVSTGYLVWLSGSLLAVFFLGGCAGGIIGFLQKDNLEEKIEFSFEEDVKKYKETGEMTDRLDVFVKYIDNWRGQLKLS